MCWCEKSSPQKMKGGEKKGTDVRRVCGHLVSVGFSAACDVCGAKISLFDGLSFDIKSYTLHVKLYFKTKHCLFSQYFKKI